MPAKIYVLVDRLNNSVPIYQRVNKDQRVRIVKRPSYAPYLQVTCQDKEGKSINLRYKEACPTFDMEIQMSDKYKIPANAKYTNSERKDREFRDGTLITTKEFLQNYLEVYPGFEGSPYTSDEVPLPEYKLYDKANLNKIQNAETRKRVKAAAKIFDLDLEQSQEMLIRLNGSFFEPTDDLEENQNMLTDWIDAADDKGLDEVLKEDDKLNVDETTTVLLGKAIKAGILSFDKVEGQISKKDKKGEFKPVRAMSSDYTLDERKRLFSDWLNSEDGKALKNDIEKDLKAIKK